MMHMRNYQNYVTILADNVNFSMGPDRQGKPTVNVHLAPDHSDVALVSPACVTNWPRCTGDGNFGTMFGPTVVEKTKFTLDLTDQPINGMANDNYAQFAALLSAIDDRLLDFVHDNQQRILGRKNLTRDEVRMLQIRSVRDRTDRSTGASMGVTAPLTTAKFTSDGCGGKFTRKINICDKDGRVVPNGSVQPGDAVAVTMYINQAYTGVGGDKFGLQWSFEDVQVVCQRNCLSQKTEVPAFLFNTYDFAAPFASSDAIMVEG